jgi:hypothetical protein
MLHCGIDAMRRHWWRHRAKIGIIYSRCRIAWDGRLGMAEVLDNADLQALLDYWLAKRGDHAMPSRADLDPLDLPAPLWPRITLFDVVQGEDGPRFRYRRVGAVFVQAFGWDPTGRFLDDVLPVGSRQRDYVVGLYRDVVAVRKPVYSENTSWRDGAQQPHRWTQRLALPLSNDGDVVDMILAAHVFSLASERDRLMTLSVEDSQVMEASRLVLDV